MSRVGTSKSQCDLERVPIKSRWDPGQVSSRCPGQVWSDPSQVLSESSWVLVMSRAGPDQVSCEDQASLRQVLVKSRAILVRS
jgi:hypothetical protein